jgi:hypothetical protein
MGFALLVLMLMLPRLVGLAAAAGFEVLMEDGAIAGIVAVTTGNDEDASMTGTARPACSSASGIVVLDVSHEDDDAFE